jgi:hypothetical protein
MPPEGASARCTVLQELRRVAQQVRVAESLNSDGASGENRVSLQTERSDGRFEGRIFCCRRRSSVQSENYAARSTCTGRWECGFKRTSISEMILLCRAGEIPAGRRNLCRALCPALNAKRAHELSVLRISSALHPRAGLRRFDKPGRRKSPHVAVPTSSCPSHNVARRLPLQWLWFANHVAPALPADTGIPIQLRKRETVEPMSLAPPALCAQGSLAGQPHRTTGPHSLDFSVARQQIQQAESGHGDGTAFAGNFFYWSRFVNLC